MYVLGYFVCDSWVIRDVGCVFVYMVGFWCGGWDGVGLG